MWEQRGSPCRRLFETAILAKTANGSVDVRCFDCTIGQDGDRDAETGNTDELSAVVEMVEWCFAFIVVVVIGDLVRCFHVFIMLS